MKKTVSFILVLIMIALLCQPAFAAKGCSCGKAPIIVVKGFGAGLRIADSEEQAFPPEAKAILKAVPKIVYGVNSIAFLNSKKGFSAGLTGGMNDIFGSLACDKNGRSIYDIKAPNNTDTNAEKHKKADTDSFFDDNYSFDYDWRIDPFDNAKLLNSYINAVIKSTGHSKVVLACHSQGSTVVATYLYRYGTAKISKLMFLSPAFKGLSLVGELFTKQLNVKGKGGELGKYLGEFIGEDSYNKLVSELVSALGNGIGIRITLSTVQRIIGENINLIYEDGIIDIFGTMPGVWTFVPDEYYENAKTELFGKDSSYSGLIKKIDKYHYNVQNRLTSILSAARQNGVAVTICAGYNLTSVPITGEKAKQSDSLIDTAYMSIGSVCAPLGEKLPASYKQAKTKCGHNHISPDRIIDASTCAYPEYTWFFKGQSHNTFTSGYSQFLYWLARYNGQPNVSKNKNYPQFLTNDSEGKLEIVK